MLGCRGAKKRWQHRDKKDQQLCEGALRKIMIDGLDTSDRWFLGRDTETHSRALLVVIDYEAAIHLWKVDKFDFVVCMSAYIGVVFGSLEIGIVLAVAISVIRVLLFVARPRTFVQGNLPNSMVYRNVEQYPNASNVPGILILEIDAPIYFANTNHLRERSQGQMNIQGSFLVCQKKRSRWFFNLKHTLQFDIGLHHAGLNDKDRSLVEELFANNKIQVLVCTRTLAWGVNLLGHYVVIIKFRTPIICIAAVTGVAQ
ncbi:hypothetical protein L3X38_015928 [Prunus dulcis]|uniref:STAS domain-containing protein n=1 Tax=Prunus dulcis TaxID=3755 RepID=A0AAD4W4B5_PRUDU|nr:hypothetical protein L3X38_015928 [Prunus dulcis]